MRLAELAQGIGTIHPARTGEGDTALTTIAGITDDSREVQPGWLFVARAGTRTDGAAFIQRAIDAGAAAILIDGDPQALPVPVVRADSAPLALALLAERFHGSPTSKLKLVAVTGTNGKSTIVHLVQQALERLGTRCGLVGSIESFDGLERAPARLTTPPAHELSALFASMLANGCTAAAMEVSSHAIDQHRAAGLSFDVGVFTNLSGDHLDYHRDMGSYARAKAKLFAQLPPAGLAIIHDVGEPARLMADHCRCPVLLCGGEHQADVRIESQSLSGQSLVLTGPWGEAAVRTRMVGAFNAMNTLQAALAVDALISCDASAISRAFEHARGPAGRLDPVHDQGQRPRVLVDFAHTDDALANSISAVRAAIDAEGGGGQLWVVFGAGGDRDASKRPRMGRVVSELADRKVVTSDNPRTEPPMAIIEQVVAGIPADRLNATTIEPDRAKAIEHTLRNASPDDVVLITGKGHERQQLISDGAGGICAIDFDDFALARRVLAQLQSADTTA